MTDRRAFLQSIGAFSVFTSPRAQVAYVATENSIHVLRKGIKIQTVSSQRPSGITLESRRQLLFAVNEISEYEGLPAGSVESYAVKLDGRLELISRASLSLSATLPKRLAVSPDGEHIVVAAFGGGAYNVLPVGENGELGPVTQIIKEIGRGPHPQKQASAHPHSVVFHPSGLFVISTDLGSDRINVFAFEAGRMLRMHAVHVRRGSQPEQLEMGAEGRLLYVSHELNSAIARYGFDTSSGWLTKL